MEQHRPPLGLVGQNGFPQADGPFYPQAQKRGFTAGATWDGEWDFSLYGGGKGETPMPTQERIGTFRRRLSEFSVEAQRLYHEARKAQAKVNTERRKAAQKAHAEGKDYVEPFSAKKAIEEANEAEAEDTRLHELLRDHTAEFCAGSPAREDLALLPDHEVLRYANYLAEQLNPEA